MSPSTRHSAGPARKTSLKEMAARIAGARVGEASTLSATPTRGGGRRERVPPRPGAPVQLTPPPGHSRDSVALWQVSWFDRLHGVLRITTTSTTFQHSETLEITQLIRASMYTF